MVGEITQLLISTIMQMTYNLAFPEMGEGWVPWGEGWVLGIWRDGRQRWWGSFSGSEVFEEI